MHVIGTAGHVDHGKSSLVAALTGTNPDRWLEEQVRGMTLDLGFAHLQLGDGLDAGIVDVPGHERFLHNMLAGAAGMELLLLVVAANEGVMPQTREHLAILHYLNVRKAIVAISKIDLIPLEQRAARIAAITGELDGTLVGDAPAVAVSSASGEGMDELRAAIAAALRALPPRSIDAPAFLPVDRSFALSGHGTIVTGTLMQGRLRVGDRLQIAPAGTGVRVRSLQVFGKPREEVAAGSRVAVNLPGIDASQAARGDVLADVQFRPARELAVDFAPAPGAATLLRRRNAVRAYFGSAEILGTLVFERPPADGETVSATVHLRAPVAVFPGERFVVRRMSPKTLLGGGSARAAAAMAGGEDDGAENAVASILKTSGLGALTLPELAARANVREDVASALLEPLLETGRAIALAKPQAFVDGAAARALLDRIVAVLREKQQSSPWIAGVTSLALARELALPEPQLIRFLAAFAGDGALAARAGYYATTDHTARLSAEQRAFFDAQLGGAPDRPFVPVPLAQLSGALKSSKIAGITQAFDTLVLRGALVKVGDDVYLGKQIEAIRARVEAFLEREGRMTMAQFRDLTGTSRKYAVPLLEWFDARAVTVRSGDFRLLRAKKAP